MFSSNFDDAPVLTSYRAAAEHEQSVTPIRGRAPECKPLGDRRKTHVTIRKEGEGEAARIICRFHSTDVLTYYPDGRIAVALEGWTSQSTMKLIEHVTRLYVCMRHGRVWVQAQHEKDTGPVFGWFPMHEYGNNILRWDDGKWIYENPNTFNVHRVNRAKTNNVRARYKDFRDYILRTMRLRDNGFSAQEMGEAFGWVEVPHPLSGPSSMPDFPQPIKVQLGMFVNREEIAQFMQLITPTDNAETTNANFYKASLWLAFSSVTFWHQTLNPTTTLMLESLNRCILFHHRDECFNEMPASAGVVTKDSYAEFFGRDRDNS